MRNAARQANQIAGLRLYPDAVDIAIKTPFLHEDELILVGVNLHRHELAGIAVGLEGKGGIGHGLGEVDLTENIPALATVTRTIGGDAFLECSHIVLSCRSLVNPANLSPPGPLRISVPRPWSWPRDASDRGRPSVSGRRRHPQSTIR